MPFYSLEDLKSTEIVPGFRGRFVHTDAMTIAYWEIDAGSSLPSHSHPQEMVINFMEGQFELSVDGETRVLKPGDVVVIPGDVEHRGTAITDCRIIDVWHPPRDDYRV